MEGETCGLFNSLDSYTSYTIKNFRLQGVKKGTYFGS